LAETQEEVQQGLDHHGPARQTLSLQVTHVPKDRGRRLHP